MRLLSPGAKAPADIKKYLLPHEQQVVSVRKHPAVLLAPVAWAAGGLIVATVVSAVFKHQSTLLWLVWLVWALVFLRFLWEAFNWAVDYFIVTTNRFILTSGVFNRQVAMMPLAKVTDMTFRRSFLGRVFGYGTFDLESAGQDQALKKVDFIPYPDQLYLEVCDLLFPSKDRSPD
jgi:uncharacterized membrane protein YdbT with pleckstrin-like domain